MSDNQWDAAGYLDDKIAKLRAENADLTAKVELLTKAHSDALADFWAIHKGYFDLKAEVDRLRAASFVTAVPSEDYEKLKSQVEALRKSVAALSEAGDDLWYAIRHYNRQDKSERLDAIEDWLYAKEKANRIR